MNGFSTTIIVGTVTGDPQGDQERTYFSLAVNHNKDKVSFYDITAFKKNAEFAQNYVRKGMHLAVEADMEWFWKPDRSKSLSLVAKRIHVITWPKKDNQPADPDSPATLIASAMGKGKKPQVKNDPFPIEEDIPF